MSTKIIVCDEYETMATAVHGVLDYAHDLDNARQELIDAILAYKVKKHSLESVLKDTIEKDKLYCSGEKYFVDEKSRLFAVQHLDGGLEIIGHDIIKALTGELT